MEFFIIISVICITVIIFIALLFWRKKMHKKRNSSEEIHFDVIIKDGIFKPAIIKIPDEKILTIRFIRQDPTGLAESISFPQLHLNYKLPIDKPIEITIPLRALILDEIDFVCRFGVYAGLYKGKIIIKR
jgi:plastocyanin domain-containing protein